MFEFILAAQVVVSCLDASPWGSSDYCGGCNVLRWKTANKDTPALLVRTTRQNDKYTAFGMLGPTDVVFVGPGKNDGDAVVCSDAVPTKISDLGIILPPPPIPIIPPAPTTTNSQEVSWDACIWNIDSAVTKAPCAPLSYHIRWYGPTPGEFISSATAPLKYTMMNLANGDYSTTVATINADGEGAPGNPVSFKINVAAPPAPTVTLTKTPGTWILKKGSSNIQTGLATEADCENAIKARATATATTYNCNLSDKYSVRKQ